QPRHGISMRLARPWKKKMTRTPRAFTAWPVQPVDFPAISAETSPMGRRITKLLFAFTAAATLVQVSSAARAQVRADLDVGAVLPVGANEDVGSQALSEGASVYWLLLSNKQLALGLTGSHRSQVFRPTDADSATVTTTTLGASGQYVFGNPKWSTRP